MRLISVIFVSLFLLCGCSTNVGNTAAYNKNEESTIRNNIGSDEISDEEKNTAGIIQIDNPDTSMVPNSDNGHMKDFSSPKQIVADMTQEQVKESINEILSELDLYAYSAVENYYQELMAVGANKQIDLSASEMIKASGLCDSVSKSDEFVIDEELSGRYIDTDSLEEMCQDLFGKTVDFKTLKTEGNLSCDVIKYFGKPIMRYDVWENETDSFTVGTDIIISGDTYSAIQYRYHGYWGIGSYKKSNFRFIYDFARNPDSKYGLTISGIYIDRTDDEKNWHDSSSDSDIAVDNVNAFFGIWCGADKSEEKADQIAAELREKGLDAKVFLTTDWENLNKDPYYVVTSGVYDSKETALSMLDDVKKAGYTDAYIKYSGTYIG